MEFGVVDQQTEGDRHNFPGKKNVEWFERFGTGGTGTDTADGVSPLSSRVALDVV